MLKYKTNIIIRFSVQHFPSVMILKRILAWNNGGIKLDSSPTRRERQDMKRRTTDSSTHIVPDWLDRLLRRDGYINVLYENMKF